MAKVRAEAAVAPRRTSPIELLWDLVFGMALLIAGALATGAARVLLWILAAWAASAALVLVLATTVTWDRLALRRA